MTYKRILRAVALSLFMACAVLASATAAATNERVDINTADAAALDRVLDNVGPAKAAAIIAHRDAHGPFRSAEELVLVRGIGLKTVEKNRHRIEVGGSNARRPAGAGGVLPRIVPVTP